MLDSEMLHELVFESREHLQSVEPDLLELEEKGNAVSDDLVNRIFRAVHSIKGGFGFFGLKQIIDLSHAMENVLSRIRDHELSVTATMTDALLTGIDKLRVLLDDVANCDSVPIHSELEALAPFRNGQHDQSKSITNALTWQNIQSRFQVSPEALQKVLTDRKHLYEIHLSTSTDFFEKNTTPTLLFARWATVCDILSCSPDAAQIEASVEDRENKSIEVLVASVLEPDLIGVGLEIDDTQIIHIDLYGENSSSVPAASMAAAVQQDPVLAEKSLEQQPGETKLAEDFLRVRVGLLNNLMNLAGELVLSRNQLLQQFDRKLIDALDRERCGAELFRSIDALSRSLKDMVHHSAPEIIEYTVSQLEKLRAACIQSLSFPLKEIQGVTASLQSIDSVTSFLQENIMQTRLQPISVVFGKFPRVVRDLARKMGKEIKLTLSGQEVELDKSIVELLSDPLTHLVRNSADHGIELPDQRTAAGKKPAGEIHLRAYQEGGKVIVEIEDDGMGIDCARVKEVAVARGLITETVAADMNDHEVRMLIMEPGFSTSREVSDLSGRGVGMDVVKSNIEKLGGSISIESTYGKGTRIFLTLPLTLAIIPSLIIASEDRKFAIPQVGVEELVRIRSHEVTKKIERIQGAEVMRLRGKLLPLVRLSTILEIEPTFIHPETGERLPDRRSRWSDRRQSSSEHPQKKDSRRTGKSDRREELGNAVKVIILKAGQHLYGLVVDMVYDNEEIVVKSLPEYLKSAQCYAGATIMGDGKVAMILDPGGIAQKAGLKFSDPGKNTYSDQETIQIANEEREILLFDNNSPERFGLDLKHVARIEKATAAEIESVGSREFLKREGSSLPLIRLHHYLSVNPPSAEQHQYLVIYPRTNGARLGILAGTVHDIIKTNTAVIEKGSIRGTGILGSAVIQERITLFIDMESLLDAAAQRNEVAL